ncbi:hypothetical protein ACLMJK_009181 [Lecanora helva]
MATLGSSRINKSSKKFAPKAAPVRRTAAPAAPQASTRSSTERETQSQTPQPQSSQQEATGSCTALNQLPTPAASQQKTARESVQVASDNEHRTSPQPEQIKSVADEATPVLIPSRNALAQVAPTSSPVAASNPPPELQQVSTGKEAQQSSNSRNISEAVSASLSTRPNLFHLDFTPTSNHCNTSGQNGSTTLSNRSNATSSSASGCQNQETEAPAAKRRRLEEPPQHSPNASHSLGEKSANVAISATELNGEAAVRPSNHANANSASSSNSRSNNPQVSAQAKGKGRAQESTAETVAGANQTKSAKPKRSRTSAKSKAADGADGVASNVPAGPAAESKRKHKRRKPNQSTQDAAAEIVEDAVQGGSRQSKKRGRKRAVTPDGADAEVISPSKMTMADLCKDGRIGRKSQREKDLAEHERAEFVRRKQQELQELMGEAATASQPGNTENTTNRQSEREESVSSNIVHNVANTVLVNGKIVIDETSLQIDRHAAAAAEREAQQPETVEENELTHKINYGSFLKRDTGGGWNALLTERFYDGLRMFGTDFQMISKMFPGRTRHKIKLKFVKEEKLNYDKIKAALLGEKLPVDLPELEKMAGVEFDDPQELEKDMEEDRRRLEEETLAEKEALDEVRREREEQIAAERAAAENESSAKENRKGKGKRKKREKRKSSKGPTKRKVKRGKRTKASSGGNVLGEVARD